MKRRFLSILMALCLALSLLPTAAFAAEEDTAETTPDTTAETTTDTTAETETTVEETNDTGLPAADGGVITLTKDVDISSTGYTVEGNITLDLAGHRLKAANTKNGSISVPAGATLTLKDSSSGGRIYTETTYAGAATGYGVIRVVGGTFTMESGSIETSLEEDPGSNGQFAVSVENGGKVTIRGGKIEAGWYAISGNGMDQSAQSTINVEGGKLVSTADYALYLPHNCVTTISGGTVTGAAGGIAQRAGTLIIQDGTIASQGTGDTGDWGDGTSGMGKAAVNVGDNDNGIYNDVSLSITGGNFTAASDAVSVNVGTNANNYAVEVSITGGSFADDVSEFVPADYQCAESGEDWKVTKKETITVTKPESAEDNTVSATVGGVKIPTVSGGDVTTDGTTLTVDAAVKDESNSVTTANVTVGGAALDTINKAETIADVEITTNVGTLLVTSQALATIVEKAAGADATIPDVTLSIVKKDGDATDGNVTYTLTATAGGQDVFVPGTASTNGSIAVTVTYKEMPDGAKPSIYYLGENGAEKVPDTDVTLNGDQLTWEVSHFSDWLIRSGENNETISYQATGGALLFTNDLSTALDAVKESGGTVTIYGDVNDTLDSVITFKGNVTINGSGTISVTPPAGNTAHTFDIARDGSLTLEGVTLDITGTTVDEGNHGGYGIDINLGGTLTLDGATVNFQNLEAATCSSKPTVYNGNATIQLKNNAKITADTIDGNFSNGGVWTLEGNSSIEISNGGAHGLSADAVTVSGGSEITVTDIAYRGISINDTYLSAGITSALTIDETSSVTVTNCGNDTHPAVYMANTAANSAGLTVEKGGKLTVTASESGKNSTISLSTGADVTNTLAGEITGSYATGTDTAVAVIQGGQAFTSLADALGAAKSGDTITLLQDVKSAAGLTIPAGVILDGANHSITYTGDDQTSGAFITVSQDGDNVTIQNVTISTGTTGNEWNYAVQFYCVDGGTMTGVTVNGGEYAAVIINGAQNIALTDCTLNPYSGAYANIEYAMGSNVTKIPSLKVDDVAGDSSKPMVRADNTTFERVKNAMSGSPSDSEVVKKITDSVTNQNSGSITITVEGTGTGNVSETIPGTSQDQGGGSGSSGGTRYSVTVEDTSHGEIRVSPSRASRGQTVTITVDPDEGYELDELVVLDSDGDEIDVKRLNSTRYTFEMPRGAVTVEASFARETVDTTFDDVGTDYWAYDEIEWAYDSGYMNGTSASTFAPGASISRQQVWMILARMSGADPASMAEARQWAMENDISDGTNPGSAVTRQQLAALLFRFAQSNGYDDGGRKALTSFPDAGSVSAYAVEPLQWATAGGIIGGTSAGTLNPTGSATRAQFAVMLYRFWNNV